MHVLLLRSDETCPQTQERSMSVFSTEYFVMFFEKTISFPFRAMVTSRFPK